MYPDFSPEVITHGNAPIVTLQLAPRIHRESPMEKGFSGADDVGHWLRATPLSKAVELLKLYATQCATHKSDRRDMVTSPNNAPMESIGTMIVGNSPKVARLYRDFRKKLSGPALDKHFSGSWYEAWCDTTVKSSFKLPLYGRSCTEPDPFKRLGFICKKIRLDLKTPHPLMCALAELAEKSTAECVTELGEIKVERVTREGSVFNAVKLTMQGFSLQDLRANIKTHVPSPDYNGDLLNMEEVFAKADQSWMESGPGGQEIDNLYSLLNDVMPDGAFSNQVRAIMKGQLDTIAGTNIASWVSQKQELTRALLAVPRKRAGLKRMKMGSFFDNSVILSVDNISDRYAVVLSGMGPATYNSTANWSYFVMGSSKSPGLCLGDHEGMSRILSCSMAQLDWDAVILARSMSYYTHISEMRIAVHGSQNLEQSHERSFPMMLMVQNNNKFAQASEMVRYIFVNCTGLCGSPKQLLDKIGWFKPVTVTQKLYMLRLCKMMDVLQAHKSHGTTHSLRLKHEGLVSTKEGGFIRRVSEYWNVAMPNELVPSESDHSLFNSFYVCRAMTMQRYNKTVSEALVLEKQLDSREEYLHVKSQCHKHELRFAGEHESLEEFLEDMTYLSSSDTGPWSASWRTQALSIMSTALKMALQTDGTVGDVFDRIHNLPAVMRTLGVSHVMNSRGSVSCTTDAALIVSSRKKDVKGKMRTTNQNSKCWKTLLCALRDMSAGVPPPIADYHMVAKEAMSEIELNLDDISDCTDSLSPLILWSTQHFAACVSKMVHKDQIGAREIAVLNAWSRVMCYYVECLSRAVRDDEHNHNLRVNLIERKDKETIVEQMLSKGLANRSLGHKVLFDSADCSKWGPSMMSSNLYLTLSSRMNSHTHKMVLRNCLSLFATKIFKIPDHFFMKVTEVQDGSDKVNEVIRRLVGMSEELGSYKDQYLRLEESMHQGILGVTSSVYGSDAQNLSNLVLEELFRDDQLRVQSHITSDDYCRLLTWTSETGVYKMAKESLAVHNEVMLNCGIKRNLQKSTMSNSYLEFNSVYHTYSGSFRPDVKQRLSYVDYGQSLDPEPNALRSMTTSAEYLRNDGGLIGSCWISVLNNSLVYHQNQLEVLYSKIGSSIYHIPLELGGMVRTDPLRHVSGPSLLSLASNYSDGSSLHQAFEQMMSHNPETAQSIEAYMDGKELHVSSMSRSGVIRLTSRPSRSSRDIREFLKSQPQHYFLSVITGQDFNTIVRALIACAHRESKTGTSLGTGLRAANCMHVHNAKIFRSNNSAYGMDQLLSRQDLDNLAIRFATGDLPDVPVRECPLDLVRLEKIQSDLDVYCQRMKIEDISWFPRKMHKEPFRMTLTPTNYTMDMLDQFDRMYSPLVSDVDAWDFLESKEVLRSRLNKMSQVSQNFLMALMTGDDLGTSLHGRLLLSNFMAGCRVKLTGVEQHHLMRNMDESVKLSLVAMSRPNYSPDGQILQFTSPRYPAMMRAGKVSKTDITGLLNMLQGDSAYDFTDNELKYQIYQTLYQSMRQHPQNFTVCPKRLTGNFNRVEYASSRLVHIQQRPITSLDHKVIGREFIVKQKGRWEHRCFVTEPSFEARPDSSTDIWMVEDLSDANYVPAVISEVFGCFFIALPSGQFIQYLSQSLMSPSKVILRCDVPLERQLDHLIDLGVRDVRLSDLVDFRDIFEQAAGYFPSVKEETAALESEEEEDDECYDIDSEEMDSDDEEMFEAGASMLSRMLALTATAAPIDPVNVQPASEMSSLHDDEEEDEEELDLSQIAPLSESQVSRPFSLVNKCFTSSNVDDVTHQYRRRMRLNSGETLYELELPSVLVKTKFRDDSNGSALQHLLREVDKLTEAESMWLKSYILESIAQQPFVKAAFIHRDAMLASGNLVDSNVNLDDDDWN
nr:MAG: RNA-dependent RNA polymerase [Sanya bunya-like virus 19]